MFSRSNSALTGWTNNTHIKCFNTNQLKLVRNSLFYQCVQHAKGYTRQMKCKDYYTTAIAVFFSLKWRHSGRDGVSNHQSHDCLLNRLFRHRSKKTPKLRVTGLCAGNSPVIDEFPARMASNAEKVSIWWRHHVMHLFPAVRDNMKCKHDNANSRQQIRLGGLSQFNKSIFNTR